MIIGKGLLGKAIEKEIGDEFQDVIIHCAGKIGGIKYHQDNHTEILYNFNIDNDILNGVQPNDQVICFGSVCMYSPDVDILREDNCCEGTLPYNAVYAMSKRVLRNRLLHMRANGIHTSFLILTNLYGVSKYKGDNDHVISSLLHKCLEAKKCGSPFEVWGDGKAEREFLFAPDAAKVVHKVLKEGAGDLLISPGVSTSIREAAETIADVVNFDGDIVYNPDMPDDKTRKRTDTTNFRDQFPYFEFTPLREGVKHCVSSLYQG